MNPQALTASAKVEAIAWAWRRGIRVLSATTHPGLTVVTVATTDDVEAAAWEAEGTVVAHPSPHTVVDVLGRRVRFEASR